MKQDSSVTEEIIAPVDTEFNDQHQHNFAEIYERIDCIRRGIECCLVAYMSKGEAVNFLAARQKIDPVFTTIVWEKLEDANQEFFAAYYHRLQLAKQIIEFNNLMELQLSLMHPLAPKGPLHFTQNPLHSMPVNNLPMGYTLSQQPSMLAFDPINHGFSSCHLTNEFPAPVPEGFHPVHTNAGSDMMFVNGMTQATQTDLPPCSTMLKPELDVSPESVTSNNFPLTPTGMGMDTTELGSSFESYEWNANAFPVGSADANSSPHVTTDTTDFGDASSIQIFGDFLFPLPGIDIAFDYAVQDDTGRDTSDESLDAFGSSSQSDEEK